MRKILSLATVASTALALSMPAYANGAGSPVDAAPRDVPPPVEAPPPAEPVAAEKDRGFSWLWIAGIGLVILVAVLIAEDDDDDDNDDISPD